MRHPASLPVLTRAAWAIAASVVYAIVAGLAIPMIITYTQSHGITSFYVLQSDELPGPNGVVDYDEDSFVAATWYVIFLTSMIQVFWLLSGPWLLFAALFVFNIPLSAYIGGDVSLLISR